MKYNIFELYVVLNKHNPLRDFQKLRDSNTLHYYLVESNQLDWFYMKRSVYIRTDMLQSELIKELLK